MRNWSILSLNPCIDRNIYLERPFVKDTLNRVGHTVVNYGGKGLNQAIAARRQGYVPQYFAFSGANDDGLSAYLQDLGIPYHPAPAACGMRMNIKILDGQSVGTECNEAGGPVTGAEIDFLVRELLQVPLDVLSMGGSLPRGMDADAYAWLIRKVRAAYPGAQIVLDCDGEAMRLALRERPDYIKPNRRELAGILQLTEDELRDDAALRGALQEVYSTYGTQVLCTLDRDGSVFLGQAGCFRVEAARVPEKGFAGAGDTYVAGFIGARLLEEQPIEASLDWASRAAAAKIAKEGTALPDREEIARIEPVGVCRWPL